MRAVAARFIASRSREPVAFHATYAALAEAMPPDGPPAVVWGRVPAHLCLGQSQTRADVRPDATIRVVRRPLGGGAVWVDRDQVSYALVAPLGIAPRRPQDWYAWALGPALQTFRRFGLDVSQRGEDLWLDGRKIAGSGSATIGRAAVVASSFLLRFSARRFADSVAAPSGAFREALHAALPHAMTDWSQHDLPPSDETLRQAFVDGLHASLGWRAAPARLRADERAAWVEWHRELSEPVEAGDTARVPGGLKLNAAWILRQRGEAIEMVAGTS